MLKEETIKYLTTLNGGEWSSEEKKKKLYELAKETTQKFDAPISVELGVFAGVSLFCLEQAHKDAAKGGSVGIETWDNVAPLEGTNSKENNEWWASLDMQAIKGEFYKSCNKLFLRPTILIGKSYKMASNFADNSITLLHQDGNHNVETITKELEAWGSKVKAGGYWICDDTDWPEAKAGYVKLPEFGFELVQDFGSWQIWRKTGEKKEGATISEYQTETLKRYVQSVANTGMIGITSVGTETVNCLQIGNYSIKPIAIHLPDTPEWVERGLRAKKHFEDSGVTGIHWMAGIHAKKFQVKGTGIYLLDNKPEEKFYVGDANVGNFLTQYCAYNVMDAMDYSHYMYLEDDCRFVAGWKEQLDLALLDIPPDFDMLYVGSCCCMGKQPELVSQRSGLYHFPKREGENAWQYTPLCTHCYIVAKKAIPYIISTQRDTANPTDISLARFSLPNLKVYAILPRLANQENTTLHP